jgi:FUN14 domain-containing protein 1
MRVGKAAATALGGGVLLITLAHHKGYITVDWDKLSRQVDRVTDKVETAATGEGPRTIDKVRKLIKDNSYLAAGFLSGFLVGVGCS